MTGRHDTQPLELQKLVKHYGHVVALRSLDLVVSRGEFLTVLGPSGSGKSTLLKLIAGFTAPTAGRILLDGRDVSQVSPADRGIGMVFQNYALFPHMSAGDNIAYGLKMRRVPRSVRQRRVEQMLEFVGLPGMEERLPRELSGGQQQRVALARALAFDPTLLLMDEPLGALDRELRVRMAAELRRIHAELKATMVYVTHDREEALTLSDRVAILREGSLEAIDTAYNLYRRPTSAFVATFFGGHNLLPGRVLELGTAEQATVTCLGQTWLVRTAQVSRGAAVHLAVPASAIKVVPLSPRATGIRAVVRDVVFLGDFVRATCAVDQAGRPIEALAPVMEAIHLIRGTPVELIIDHTQVTAVATE